MVSSNPPPISHDSAARDAVNSAQAALRERGWAFAEARDLLGADLLSSEAWTRFTSSWNALPPDGFLKDGGKYRYRRHSCFIQPVPGSPRLVPHRAHWQPTTYNALHGGMHRWFEPIEDEVRSSPLFVQLVERLGALFAAVDPVPEWYIEAHQFRIDASQGVGKPTPEGAHRDGVDFVALLMIQRATLSGGRTTIVDAQGAQAWSGELSTPGTLMLLDDRRVMHETTPILPTGASPVRDTLVLTYRRGGFMESENP